MNLRRFPEPDRTLTYYVRESSLNTTLRELLANNGGYDSVTLFTELVEKVGWGNGYVRLPKGHPCYGMGYEQIDVDVNGGLTYAAEETYKKKKYWVVGFDTAHYGDTPEKWSQETVEAETIRLKEQLEELWN